MAFDIWPSLLQAAMGVFQMVEGYALFKKNKHKAKGIETRSIVLADELFGLDQQLKNYKTQIWEYGDNLPEYSECATHPGRRRVDVLRAASHKVNNSIGQPGRGQIGLRKSIIRDYGLIVAGETGARMGEAQAFEMRTAEAYSARKVRARLTSTSMARYPTSIVNAFGSAGASYQALSQMGGEMFNGGLATFGYALGQLSVAMSYRNSSAQRREAARSEPYREDLFDKKEFLQERSFRDAPANYEEYRPLDTQPLVIEGVKNVF